VDETGAVEKVGVVVNEVRRVPKEASKVSRDATTPIHFFDRIYGTFDRPRWQSGGVLQAEQSTSAKGHLAERIFVSVNV
jgi:hypothetical protein